MSGPVSPSPSHLFSLPYLPLSPSPAVPLSNPSLPPVSCSNNSDHGVIVSVCIAPQEVWVIYPQSTIQPLASVSGSVSAVGFRYESAFLSYLTLQRLVAFHFPPRVSAQYTAVPWSMPNSDQYQGFNFSAVPRNSAVLPIFATLIFWSLRSVYIWWEKKL